MDFELVARPPEDFAGAITQIAQDQQGFIWFAAESGLFKYDGQRYISHTHDPINTNTPADFKIWGMMLDREGIIWLLPGGFGLDRFDPVTEKFMHYRHNDNDSTTVSHDQVTAVFEDRDGKLWVGTTAGLDKFDKTTQTFTHYRNKPDDPNTISCNQVRVIYEDRQGVMWIGTGNQYDQYPWTEDHIGGLNKFDKRSGTFTRFTHKKGDTTSLADNRVEALLEDSRGTFWVGRRTTHVR